MEFPPLYVVSSMKSPEIEALYASYIKESASNISDEQFGTLLMFFPSLLVIACDGVVDEEEWVYVKYLSKFMADTFKDEIADKKKREKLQDEYFQELSFLLKHLDSWKEKFLSTLHSFLVKNEEMKEEIVDILYLFADASEGESEEETKMIEFLKKKLDLE